MLFFQTFNNKQAILEYERIILLTQLFNFHETFNFVVVVVEGKHFFSTT